MNGSVSRRTVLRRTIGLGAVSIAAPSFASDRDRADRLWAEFIGPSIGRPLVQAHRGNHEYAPENSLRAFDAAIAVGADIVELDVRRTRDGVLVVMHDADVRRTTTGSGAVSALLASDIAALRLRGPGGGVMQDHVPTFAQALKVLRGRILVTVDIKDSQPDIVPAVVAAVHQAGMARRVIYYSDDLANLDLVHRIDPEAVTLPLAGSPVDFAPLIARFAPKVMHLKPRYLSPMIVADLHSRGLRSVVNALHSQRTATDDLDEGYEAILASGVDIIQTNRPTQLIEAVRSRSLNSGAR